jgi:hypothetical protein
MFGAWLQDDLERSGHFVTLPVGHAFGTNFSKKNHPAPKNLPLGHMWHPYGLQWESPASILVRFRMEILSEPLSYTAHITKH